MKDYKKILEGLVNIINNTEKSDIGFANICTFIGENCPELKESEDERIRGAIIDHLKDRNLTEWVAWLEKQGNTNIFDVPKISIKNAVEVTSRMQYIDDDIKPIAEFIMDYANWDLNKDKWNQPTLTVPLFRVLDALIQKGKPYCECNQNIEKQGEQKSFDYENANIPQKDSTWGEEDENFMHDTLGNLTELKDRYGEGYGKVGKCIEWLKSLKDRVQPQSKQEWSEDDKKMFGYALDMVEWYSDKNEDKSRLVSDWLKSKLNDGVDGKIYNITYNPNDKIEPKFKVGDWVIDKQGIVHQVSNIVENVTNHTYGYDIVGGGYFNGNTEGVRLWNISDAKDGDILHSIGFYNDCIFIFNGLDNWKFDEPNGDRAVATGYCCLSVSADNMEFGMQGPDCVEVNTVKPATKIQRDFLFRKIKEAGYKWDAEKKELKKIRQKPVWSEEDESNFQGIIDVIKENKHHATDYEHMTYYKLLSWFKSLKNRYVWKPSDEQMKALDWALSLAKNCGDECAFDLRTLQEQLKKI